MPFTKNNDINILQAADTKNVGAGLGDDIYVVANGQLTQNQTVTVTDTSGVNTLRLVGGLTITTAQVSGTTLKLTLSNDAEITILGANNFSFGVGGDAFGNGETVQTYSEFATNTLGLAALPQTGSESVSNVVISGGGGVPPVTDTDTFTLVPMGSQFEGFLWEGADVPAILDGLQSLTLVAGDKEYTDIDWYYDLYESLLDGYQVWSSANPILTPTQSNAGVLEGGFTTSADEVIQGNTSALNGAWVDGGGGDNTLIVDMNGSFAQPARLENIQTVVVQNMPNTNSYYYEGGIYTAGLNADTNSILCCSENSILDLSRALDVEKVIATDTAGYGDLTILNIQNGADLRMEGRFDSGVSFDYGYGAPGEVNLELYAVRSSSSTKIADDAYIVNVNSLGGQNVLTHANLGPNLENLTVTGDARLVVTEWMDNFASYGPATIDASANTAGVYLGISNHDNVSFTGTAANDEFGLKSNRDSNNTLFDINTGAGKDTVLLDSVIAGDGSKINGDDVTVYVKTNADLSDAAELNGITSVVIESGLTITQQQFTALKAGVFEGFQQNNAELTVEITEDAALKDIVVLSDLADNVNLNLNITKGATLTISAQELHNYVAEDGIITGIAGQGYLVITNAGLGFDPFNTGNVLYQGGTLDGDPADWVNLVVERSFEGFERPGTTDPTDTLIIDSTGEAAPLVIENTINTIATTLIVKGDQDVVIKQPVTLGNDFTVDFSALTANLGNAADGYLTLANFEAVKNVIGNGAGSRIDVVVAGQVGESGNENGLESEAVETYVVTGIVGDSQDFYVCDNTKGLQFLGLQGNANKIINFNQVKWGVEFLLEGDGFADWNELSKADFNPDASNIGTLNATFFYPGAPAVVNINNQGVALGETSTGEERPFYVDGIHIFNAASLTVNVAEGDAVINEIDGSDILAALTINAEEDIAIEASLPTTLTKIDAAGVMGQFNAVLDNMDGAFELLASDNGMTLVFNDGFAAAEGTIIDGGAGEDSFIIAENGVVDFTNAALTDIDSVVMQNGADLTLTSEQTAAIELANITVDVEGNNATLNVTNLGEELFDASQLAEGVQLGSVTIAPLAEVTLNPATDLTGADDIFVPEGTVLNMTAAQFLQLEDGEITGLGTVNITDLTQADVDAGFNLNGVAAVNGTITLADDVVILSVATELNEFAIELAEDQRITLSTDVQAHDRVITGAANTTVAFAFPFGNVDTGIDWDGDLAIAWPNEIGINTANYTGINELEVLETLVEGRNVEQILANLHSSITVNVVAEMDGAIPAEITNRVVVVDPNVVVDGGLLFDDLNVNSEVQTLDLTLLGGVNIAGNLDLSEAVLAVNGQGFQKLTINSEGNAPNVMGNIFAANNSLFNIEINASQPLTIGQITFSSLAADDPATAAIENAATLTVNGAENVAIAGLVNDLVNPVNDLAIVNEDGVLTLTVDDNTVQLSSIDGDADDNGTGGVVLVIDGNVDLSAVDLDDINQVVMNTGSVLTLSIEQVNDIDPANFEVSNLGGAAPVLNINNVTNASLIDVTVFDAGIDVGTLFIADAAGGVVTLDPGTNLTDVDMIVVPDGTTLNMTAGQFQQLLGIGTVVGLGTVNITDLTQADIDAGFDLNGVAAVNGTITLSDDVVILDQFDTFLNGFAINLAANQSITLSNDDQAHERVITGAADTTVSFAFPIGNVDTQVNFLGWGWDIGIDTANYSDITTLQVLTTLVEDRNLEQILANLDSSINVSIIEEPAGIPGAVDVADMTNRKVFVEPGVTVDGNLLFDDLNIDTEVATLDLTLKGDAEIDGTVSIQENWVWNGEGFKTLTINSEGTAANVMGDINAVNNNLLDIKINATQALNIDTIFFNSDDGDDPATPAIENTATLTVNAASTAAITIEQLTTAWNVAALNVVNNGTGAFVVTGGSPAFDGGSTETLTLSGSGSMVFGSDPTAAHPADDRPGIDGWGFLSTLNAAALTGNLALGDIDNIDSNNGFTFTSGTGVTTLTLDNDWLNNGAWTFNLSNAAANSVMTINNDVWFNGGTLTTNLGSNAELSLTAWQAAGFRGLDVNTVWTVTKSGVNQVTVDDTTANIQLTLAALFANAKVDKIDSTENATAIILTAAQGAVPANTAKLTADDTITVSDNSAAIQANLAALLAAAPIDNIDSTENAVAINLTAAQYLVAANMAKMQAGDTLALADTSANIQTNLAALLADAKIDNIDSNQDAVAINLTAAQYLVPANMAKMQAGDTLALADTTANIQTNLAALFADAKIDNIDSTENAAAIVVTAAQQGIAANMAKLQAGDTITVADTSANINGSIAALFADAKIDNIDSNQDAVAININADQGALAANTDKLAAGDNIVVVDSTANIQANLAVLLGNAKIDSIDSTDDLLPIGLTTGQAAVDANWLKLADNDLAMVNFAATYAGAAVFTGMGVGDILNLDLDTNWVNGGMSADAASVAADGDWFFDNATDVLTYWDEAGTQKTVTLTGVATLNWDGLGTGLVIATMG